MRMCPIIHVLSSLSRTGQIQKSEIRRCGNQAAAHSGTCQLSSMCLHGLPPCMLAWVTTQCARMGQYLVFMHELHAILHGATPHLSVLISCVLPPCVPPRGTVQCTCYHLVCMHGLPSSCILPHHGACMQLRIIVKSHMYAIEKCYFLPGFFPECAYCIFIYMHIQDMISSFAKAGKQAGRQAVMCQ